MNFRRRKEYLSKMLDRFREKGAPADKPSEDPPHKLFDAIADHISRHLACDPHQLTLLTLWVAHTWCYESFPTAVHLSLSSPEPQSGKTLCLNLLRQLAYNPSFFTGASPASITKYLLIEANRIVNDQTDFDLTLFFDDCHHTLAFTERQPLLALLNSGVDSDVSYFSAPHAYSFFGPKAFSSNVPLPQSLAQRCIPITLRRKKPSDKLSRFHPDQDQPAANFVNQLLLWTNRNSEALAQAAQNPPPRMPEGLIPREQASAEPLIHIADRLGGSWPDRARTAVKEIFRKTEGTASTELLCDLRVAFYNRKDPEYLGTKEILAALSSLDHRPWAGWTGAAGGKKLAILLRPYRINPKEIHPNNSVTSFKGYRFKQFQDAWERYTPPLPAATEIAAAASAAT